jgi:adenylosuccinate synthase
VRALEHMSGAPFSAVGVGPDREQTLNLRPLL